MLFERRVSEKYTIGKCLERVLMRFGGKRNTAALLHDYLDIDNVVVLIRDIGERNKKSTYFMCDMHSTLRESIENTKMLEFPRLDVALKRDLHLYQIVERRPKVLPEDGKKEEEPRN
ncbi:HIT zinc finger, putative [Babesia ovata]|uniref:HIT zinc finger, putative n=1 Tax=Babesia ovata TaxID=189622 RepID=A0A2H6KH69_9APIC|nr:HIT zinc finger, putative [Babesia ovata]GBE62340.1 HIT zinc finger, putative [Babesia ovata]